MRKTISIFIVSLIMVIGLLGCGIESHLPVELLPEDSEVTESSPEAVTHLEDTGFSGDALIGTILLGGASRTGLNGYDSNYMKIVSRDDEEVVIEIDFRPGNGKPDKTRLLLSTYFKNPVEGYTMNIGDSATNDGNGGDSGTQENDAELHIKDNTLAVYLSDKALLQSKKIHTEADHTTDNYSKNIRYEISDCRLRYWKDFQSGGSKYVNIKHNYLWALNGQPDKEGPENYIIYIAFNRVVKKSSNRRGSGVDIVYLYLC
ncbi:MAG: hypothetical protein JW881_02965 [Spirochaetales bacterium]|nr:hypothetical protein [Spirochaetales bacterium]